MWRASRARPHVAGTGWPLPVLGAAAAAASVAAATVPRATRQLHRAFDGCRARSARHATAGDRCRGDSLERSRYIANLNSRRAAHHEAAPAVQSSGAMVRQRRTCACGGRACAYGARYGPRKRRERGVCVGIAALVRPSAALSPEGAHCRYRVRQLAYLDHIFGIFRHH